MVATVAGFAVVAMGVIFFLERPLLFIGVLFVLMFVFFYDQFKQERSE